MRSFPLPKRRLGRTELLVTPIGLGGAHLGRVGPGVDDFSDELGAATVLRALELGVNLIDTAPMYGDSRRRIGMGLEEWYRRGGRREDVLISSKTGRDGEGGKDYSADGTRRSVEESLRLLRTDYLDVLLVHDPDDLSLVLGPGGALEALKGLKDQGVIRAIGLGVRSHETHRRCMETGDFDVSLTYCDYNLIEQSALDGVVRPAAAHDVGVLNGAVVMLGLLGGRDPRQVARELGGFATPERLQCAAAMWDWAQSRRLNFLALNLQLCIRQPLIASTLVGVSNPMELETDTAAVSEEIADETWQELSDRFGIS
ncbi:aldo/keto reductase [PVC group bacterium]|nr:aldo/keto reductase [PVC group bacterium]